MKDAREQHADKLTETAHAYEDLFHFVFQYVLRVLAVLHVNIVCM